MQLILPNPIPWAQHLDSQLPVIAATTPREQQLQHSKLEKVYQALFPNLDLSWASPETTAHQVRL